MGTPIPAAQWNVTDQQVLALCQAATLETIDNGATWASGMWTQAEIVGYLNDIQRDFLSKTGITRAVSYFTGLANTSVYNLPANLIDLRRLAWREGTQGTNYVELARADTWEMDNGQGTWPIQAASVPSMYLTDQQPSLAVRVNPPPGDVGEAEMTFTSLGTDCDGTGIALSVPDDWTPYLWMGVLAKMFSKDGEANDPDRAAYCWSRYQEGIDLGRLLVEDTI